jgi:hypothetical protein
MAHSQLFDYEVSSFSDVVEHLDALWYEFNELVTAISARQVCSDPPNTCGAAQSKKRRPGKTRTAKPARKARK